MEHGRTSLLKATVRVVAERGMRGLTFRAVAAEAGVTHGLVTHHFGSRDALITAAFREEARVADARKTLAPGHGRVDEIGRELSRIVEEQTLAERYQYEMILESLRRPELRDDVRMTYRSFLEALESELALMGIEEDPLLARVIFAALDGLIIQQLIFDDAAGTDAATERLREMVGALLQQRASDRLSDELDDEVEAGSGA